MRTANAVVFVLGAACGGTPPPKGQPAASAEMMRPPRDVVQVFPPAFFVNDHRTGARAFELRTDGTYVVIGREHFGVSERDAGRWRQARTGELVLCSSHVSHDGSNEERAWPRVHGADSSIALQWTTGHGSEADALDPKQLHTQSVTQAEHAELVGSPQPFVVRTEMNRMTNGLGRTVHDRKPPAVANPRCPTFDAAPPVYTCTLAEPLETRELDRNTHAVFSDGTEAWLGGTAWEHFSDGSFDAREKLSLLRPAAAIVTHDYSALAPVCNEAEGWRISNRSRALLTISLKRAK